MDQMARLTLRGFKSIRSIEELALGPLNLLIGPNGAGKSNLIAFFKMLSWMTGSTFGSLQQYIGKHGRSASLLFDGPERTPQITFELTFLSEQGENQYAARLFHAAEDTLIFAEEKFRYSSASRKTKARWRQLEAGHRESRLLELADQGDQTAHFVLRMIRGCKVYQFHNTSETARIRQSWSQSDNAYLREDGANLAPFLLRLKRGEPLYYRRIVAAIRQAMPFFDDFTLEPENGRIILQWREQGSDVTFSAHQMSDGSLRVIALMALLLQPESNLPLILILDEPELGLHPFAIHTVAGLIKSAALNTQIIAATQSTALLNYFEPEQVIIVNREADRASTFHRLDAARLADWLEEYSLAELWEKNVLGGRPA